MPSTKDVHSRELGPYYVPYWLESLMGIRERQILDCRTCCHFPHKLNRDLDDYINDDCITYSSKVFGHFTINAKARQIIN